MNSRSNIEVEGKSYKKCILYIKIPETLDADIKKSMILFYKKQQKNET